MSDFYKNKIFLAPMAGVTDLAFRTLCKEYGADLVVSEMISSRGLHYKDKKTSALLKTNEIEHPLIVQLFGNEPDIMAESAKILEDSGVKYIDINMGCPAPKIVKNGDGCALMKDELLASKILECVVRAVSIPVSVKFRSGWDSENINAVSFAKAMESAGASAVTVHGRTREQFYSATSDKDIIKQVKESVNIPVIGNGDIVDGKTAAQMISYTCCDSVMIGRGALGNPFIFDEIRHYLKDAYCKKPDWRDKKKAMLNHIDYMQATKPENIGVPEMRKHIAWYMKGLPYGTKFKVAAFLAKSYEELKHIIDEISL